VTLVKVSHSTDRLVQLRTGLAKPGLTLRCFRTAETTIEVIAPDGPGGLQFWPKVARAPVWHMDLFRLSSSDRAALDHLLAEQHERKK
jgi:hypothetical protein